jgi:hypothetical protein
MPTLTMRWAVYDIGSNSVKLLVADSNTRAWNVVLEKSMVTRRPAFPSRYGRYLRRVESAQGTS